MKVVFLTLGIFGREGGIERFNRRVLSALEVFVAEGSLDAATSVALWDDPADPRRSGGVLQLRGGGRKSKTAFIFLKELLRRRPDLILYGHPLLAPMALVARILSPGARHILFVHGYEVWQPAPKLTRWVFRIAFDTFAAVSDYTADRMQAAYGLQSHRFRRVVNAVDVPTSATNARSRNGGALRLLTVSRLSRQDRAKNVDQVLLALPEILKRYPATLYSIIGDGDLRGDLEQLTDQMGLSENVRFLGNVPDDIKESEYRSADIFVLPSTQEGFGIVYLEAWAHRLPVVGGNGGAGPEVVRPPREGLVVEPEPSAIVDAVCQLAADPQLRRRMGAAGFERLMNNFTDHHFRSHIAALLDLGTVPSREGREGAAVP